MYDEERRERTIYENVCMHTYNTKRDFKLTVICMDSCFVQNGLSVSVVTLFFLVADSDKKNITF